MDWEAGHEATIAGNVSHRIKIEGGQGGSAGSASAFWLRMGGGWGIGGYNVR